MAEIWIETDFARQTARQLVLSGEAVALIVRDLEVAISAVTDYGCQGEASKRLADELAGWGRGRG